MNVLTLGNTRATVARAMGVCPTSDTVRDFINESQQRLIQKGDWAGVFMRYRVCVNDSCLVWPRQIEEIEAVAICKQPGTVRNEWFEFLGSGWGLMDSDDNIGYQLLSTGTSCAFDWVRGSGKTIRVYAMSATDAGKKIVLKYYDSSAQKVITSIDGTYQEGEEITLVAPPAYAVTANEVMPSGLYGVVKPVTNFPVILYEYDGATNTRTLAQYEPQETNPIYKVSMIPGISQFQSCPDSTGDCAKKWVTVMARLRHIPVVNDNDPLVLGCLAAFKLMAMSIQKEEANMDQQAVMYETRALNELEHELRASLGQGPVVALRVQNRNEYGPGGVYSFQD